MWSSLAKKAFKTSPSGERLFFPSGFLSKPFIVPDDSIEKKLFKKQIIINKLILLLVFISFSLMGGRSGKMMRVYPDLANKVTIFAILMLFIILLYRHIIFRHELSILERTKSYMFEMFFEDVAKRSDMHVLVAGNLVCSLVIPASIFVLNKGELIGLLGLIMFLPLSFAYSYTLYLKFRKD